MSITLKENNTVVIAAKVYVEVAAKTWIWKGVNFGFLGCLKMTSCNGQTVTYSANVDCKISFQVFWREDQRRLNIAIKPVDTKLNDVSVRGCRPPWYLWWFKKWQSLLNDGVREAFEEFANNYEHMAEVPEQVQPIEGVYVAYKITDLHWTRDYVLFQANASFSAAVDGKNKTFRPTSSDNKVPMDLWRPISRADRKSHLLQGVRLSTEFLNSLMWYASMTNVTRYRGDAVVLDSQINGTVSYTPPAIRVEEDEVLSIGIGHGLLLATCKPTYLSNNSTAERREPSEPATLFRAEFYDLAGRGKIRLASTSDKTGITVSLDQMDLSNMNTKPFEPKLPLPESFENELMKNAISQLQPVVNNYLRAKPLYLPDNLAPFAAAPELRLVKTGDGVGYAELTNYCTCDESKRTEFAVCDPRSHICDGKGRRSEEEEAEDRMGSSEEEGDDKSFKDSVKNGFKNVVAFATGILNRDDSSEESGGEARSSSDHHSHAVNFTALFEGSKSDPSYVGRHLTFYDDSLDCNLDGGAGSSARVYWLWQTSECSPLFLHGEYLSQFYLMDSDSLRFGCSDSSCKFCEYNSLDVVQEEEKCVRTSLGQSYKFGQPDVRRWPSSSNHTSVVANVFFDKDACAFYPRYVEPQMISSHVNVGFRGHGACQETDGGGYINLAMSNSSFIDSVKWECSKDCFGCLFNVVNAQVGDCRGYRPKMRVLFTNTVPGQLTGGDDGHVQHSPLEEGDAIFVAVICSILLTVILVGTIAICYKCKKSKPVAPNLSPQPQVQQQLPDQKDSFKDRVKRLCSSTKSYASQRFGNRFLLWRNSSAKDVREDVLQNCFLVANGVLAIVFAVEWNSDNNPLLIIQNKFKNGLSVSVDVLDTAMVTAFVHRLNRLTLAVNAANAAFSFLLVLLWCCTTVGSRASWIKIRLLSSASLLASLFVVIATVIFTTYFDELVSLRRDQGVFVTDNASMHGLASSVIRVSLNGFSLTVISFTIVFLFHGVGGGLYCGTVVFRALHVNSKRSNLELLTTLLVILTIIQPFICIHPVIIWSQDSNQNSTFLLLVIFIWFLPVGVHVIMKSIITNCRPRCEKKLVESAAEGFEMDAPSAEKRLRRTEEQERCNRRKNNSMLFFDLLLQLTQLAIFLATFSLITHHIIHTEFNQDRRNLQDFILPAIISVFFWMASTSYFLLALVLDDSHREKTRLVFKDQNLDAARDLLRNSLRRRLANMDDRVERRRTIQRHKDLDLGASFASSTGEPSLGRRRTLPPGIDLSESMRGRRVLPRDSAMVIVNSRMRDVVAANSDDDGDSDSSGSIRERINKFERAQSNPGTSGKTKAPARPRPALPPKPPPKILRQRSKNAEKYVQKQEIITEVVDSMPAPEIDAFGGGKRESVVETSRQPAKTDSREEDVVTPSGCCGKVRLVLDFLLERREYKDPVTYGWRIKFRRLFLGTGVVLFTYLTIHTTIATQDFSAKEEIQQLLDYAGTNLTWPDSGSVLDDVFQLYNSMERTKSYIMIASTLLFWASLACDAASYFTPYVRRKSLYFTGSRVTNFFGSLAIFAGVIVVGLPDYLSASRLDEICPFCGEEFNRTIRQVAEFAIGLFFACLFTFQLIPILVTIVPALVRASVLILIHPSLQIEDLEGATLRMSILQQVIQFSSLLTFPITFISMAIVQQYQKNLLVSLLILAFWTLPPAVLMVGLHYTRKFRRYKFLLYVYYLYNFCYFLILLCLLLYAMTPERIVQVLGDLMREPTFWAGSVAQVFLCNVVISDMLYMTVF